MLINWGKFIQHKLKCPHELTAKVCKKVFFSVASKKEKQDRMQETTEASMVANYLLELDNKNSHV